MGVSALARFSVRLVCPVPLAFIKKMSDLERNAIFLPSGDQSGLVACALRLCVRFSCWLPLAAFIV